jgi:hypothetical protein
MLDQQYTPKDLSTLAKEYKTAEEFIKSQGKPLYHGTNAMFDSFDIGKVGTVKYADWGDGIYFSPRKADADYYRGEAIVKNDATVQALDSKFEELAKEYGTTTMDYGADLGSGSKGYKAIDDARKAWVSAVEIARSDAKAGRVIQAYISPDAKVKDVRLNNQTPDPTIARDAKREGYDVVQIYVGKRLEEVVVMNPDVVNTKEKLRKIWEDANKKPTKKQEETNKLVSRVSERMAGEYSEITPETYERIGIANEIENAVKAMEKDKEQTFRDAMGITEIPEYERAAKNIVLTEKALEEGNFELAAQLIKNRSLRATELGQAIAMEKGSVTDNSAQKYMRELIAVRVQKLGDKYTSTIDKSALKKQTPVQRGQKVLKERVAKVKSEISTKKKLDIQSAQDFIKSLQCN